MLIMKYSDEEERTSEKTRNQDEAGGFDSRDRANAASEQGQQQ